MRVETIIKQQLTIDWKQVPPLVLDPAGTPISAELAPALGGATDMSKVTAIDLEQLPDGFRLQRLVFQAARKAFAELSHGFTGTSEYLAVQLVRIVEAFLRSDRLDVPSLFHSDPLRRRILIALNIDLVVQHVLSRVTEQNTERLTPVFDEENPIGTTGRMRIWYTTKPCFPTVKSHISRLVGDSSWEGHAANVFETRDEVSAFVKNDHLGFHIYYMWAGSRRRYVPDFVVRLADGKLVALEIKETDSHRTRRSATR